MFFGSLANIDLKGNPRVRTLKTEKIFSAHNDQGSLKHELPEKVCKFLTQKIFSPSYSRYVTLKAELPLPSSCCKWEACLPRSHFKGETSSQKSYIEG